MFNFKNFFPPGRSRHTNKEILKEFEKFLFQVNPNIPNSSFYSRPNDEKENKTFESFQEDIMPDQGDQEVAIENEYSDLQVSQAFVPDEEVYQILEPEIIDDPRDNLEDSPIPEIVPAKWVKAEIFDKIKDVLPKKELEIKEDPPEILQEINALAIIDDNEEDVLSPIESKVTKTEILSHKKDSSNPKKCAKVSSQVLDNFISESFSNDLLPTIVNPFKAKVPVVLAEFQVQLLLSSTIKLPEPALEIKGIRKNVKLTQCLLLQEPGTPTNPGSLFIKGFVRKNIDYATSQCTNSEGVCGDIRHCTVDVPYSCVTTVTYQTMPLPILENSVSQFQFSRKERLPGQGFSEKDQLLSGDMSEFNQISMEYFNELPYCDMVSARILEYDEFIEGSPLDNKKALIGEKEFRQIEEKVVLTLTLKLLQNQQVMITPTPQVPALFPEVELEMILDNKVEASVEEEPENISQIEETAVEVEDTEEDITAEIINIAKLQQSMEEFLNKNDIESS